MKNLYTYLFIVLLMASCGDKPSTTTAAETSQQPAPATEKKTEATPPPVTPPALEKQFDKIIDEYQKHITTDFWDGPDRNFFMNKYDKFMVKKGFTKTPNTWNDYTGKINDVEVSVKDRGATSGEHGGFIQTLLFIPNR